MLSNILDQLQEEKVRIDNAIEALSGRVIQHRQRRSLVAANRPLRKKRVFSKEQRDRISKAQKARWAKRKQDQKKAE